MRAMRPTILFSLWLAFAICLGSGAAAARSGADRPSGTKVRLPVDEVRNFAEIFERIKNDYVEPVSDKKLLESAIRGMLSGLDPHSSYLDERDYRELRIGTTGEFGGLGIEVGMEDGFVKVIAPIDDTPAQRAGIKSGDLIIRIDDKPVKGLSLDEAVKLMRGKPGTPITLTIVREGVEKPFKVTIVRAVVKVASVKSRLLEPGYAYVRITNFQAPTAEDMVQAVKRMKTISGGKIKGLVLDLRNNPGGVLSGAVAVSDAFLEKGLIVYTKGRVADSQLRFEAGPGDIIDGAPMVVLVNGGSASASEIVAGALQDHRRAIIMGKPTFGKGSVQTIIPVSRTTAIKLTTARYYTPSGRSIQAEGIRPDILLQDVKVEPKEEGLEPLKEANLSHHLENGDARKAKKKKKHAKGKDNAKGKGKAGKEATGTQGDYQITEALNMLKGLHILQQAKHKN